MKVIDCASQVFVPIHCYRYSPCDSYECDAKFNNFWYLEIIPIKSREGLFCSG